MNIVLQEKKEKDVKIEINNPIYDVEGRYLAIGENNGQRLYLISEDHVIWEKKCRWKSR